HGDVVERYGGEEFAIILPFAGVADVKLFAEKAVRAVREAGLLHEATERQEKVVTISAGCCTLIASGQQGEAERLKERADKALYDAKRNGRNRAEMSA
ncbi:diguanylate cyclase domain-containing protein, partial [Mixta calida]|uniref:diguanylate cyclase domain-containing protein n=1 Tax=Mixta calida TaxID=665913 RepID=UPI0028A8D126